MILPLPLRAETGLESFPWATAVLVGVTALASIAGFVAGEEAMRPWTLEFGAMNPWQWITSVFLHAGVVHLLGNLLFLWVFGLVAEAGAGGLRFLALYLLLGIATSAMEQATMLDRSLGDPPGALGASAAICGIMTSALLWAPRNQVEGVLIFGFVFRPFRATVLTYAFLYVGWDLVDLGFYGFRMSASLAHLLGAATGWLAAWAMLRLGWVDTGGWDIFSVGRKRRG